MHFLQYITLDLICKETYTHSLKKLNISTIHNEYHTIQIISCGHMIPLLSYQFQHQIKTVSTFNKSAFYLFLPPFSSFLPSFDNTHCFIGTFLFIMKFLIHNVGVFHRIDVFLRYGDIKRGG